jgi:hypothetical protein
MRPALAAVGATAAHAALAALASGKFHLVIYHRALERMNNDSVVMKTMYDGGRKRVSGVLLYTDGCDGFMHGMCMDDVEHAKLTAKHIVAGLLPKLSALMRNGERADHFCTIDEPRDNDEETDTEWSFVEVLLFASHGVPEGGPTPPLCARVPESKPLLYRVHQVARYTVDARYKDDSVTDTPATRYVSDVIAAASAAAVDAQRPELMDEDEMCIAAFGVQLDFTLSCAHVVPTQLLFAPTVKRPRNAA